MHARYYYPYYPVVIVDKVSEFGPSFGRSGVQPFSPLATILAVFQDFGFGKIACYTQAICSYN